MDCALGHCCWRYSWDVFDMVIRPASEHDSMREATFTVSPKRQYRGFVLPTTDATTRPEWNPHRIRTNPFPMSSGSTGTWAAALTASSATRAPRSVWSACRSGMPPAHM